MPVVYLVVVGAITSIALALEEREGENDGGPSSLMLIGLFFAAAIYLMLSQIFDPHHARHRDLSETPSTCCFSPPGG